MKLARAAGILYADKDFQMWIDWNRSQPTGMTDEEAAKLFLYRACQITSRKELDKDGFDHARHMFAKIRTAYLKEMREVKAGGTQKTPPFRSGFYLRWVKSLTCVASGQPADDPHHVIGHGQGKMGSKASDLFTIPLTREQHDALHRDVGEWERQYGSQWAHVAKTLELAVREGVLAIDG